MRYPTLLSSVVIGLAVTACGGSNEPANNPEAEHSAEKAEAASDKAADKAEAASDKAADAASDAKKAEKEAESK